MAQVALLGGRLMKWDPTISAGHVMTATVLAASVFLAYADLKERLALVERDQSRFESQYGEDKEQFRKAIERFDRKLDDIRRELKEDAPP